MEFVCYSDWQQLPQDADRLFELSSRESIFFSRLWFENLTETSLAENKLVLACVINDSQVHAILVLQQSTDGQLSPLTHLYTSLYTLLLDTDNQSAIINKLLAGLEQLPMPSLQFNPIAEDDSRLIKLEKICTAKHYQCHRNFRFYNWVYDVQGRSFEQYMAERPSQVRNTIARKQRKLEREHAFEIRLYNHLDIDQGLTDFRRVYRASWKAQELYDSFIDGLTQRLAKAGWLRLGVLYIDHQPAAAQFWFVVHHKASIFKLAYDEQWKRYSPGSILTRHLMHQVIAIDQVDEIDFLTGNDRYKSDWMGQRRQRVALYCGRPPKPSNAIIRWLKTLALKK